MKQIKIFISIFLMVFGTTLAVSFLVADEWEQPTQDHPDGGFVRPVEDEGTAGVYYISRPLEINDDFLSGTDNLYVDTDNGRVGIGTNAPVTTLEVSGGGTQLLPTTALLGCNALTLGSLIFYNSMPRVCTSSGWQILHADLDNDGQY